MDLIDIKSVWGMDEQVAVAAWAKRAYPNRALDDTVKRAWERLKQRLRKHGISVRAPTPHDTAVSSFGGRPANEASFSWLVVPATKPNCSRMGMLVKRLDDKLLSLTEYDWRERDRRVVMRVSGRRNGR